MALVTGGAGFIGSHIVEALLADDWKVEVWDNLRTGSAANLPQHPQLDFRQLDVTRPSEWGSAAVPDVVVHCAAQTKVIYSAAEPVEDVRVNVGGTVALIQRFPDTPFVFLSTLGAMFSEAAVLGQLDERSPPSPMSVYGLSKSLCEVALERHHSKWVALRLSNVYGPRQRSDLEGGVVSIFLQNASAGAPLRVYGDGRQTRDFLFVGDVVRAVMLAAATPVMPNTVVHLCRGQSHSVLELVGMIRRTGVAPEVITEPARPGEQRFCSFPAPARAHAMLKWEPRGDLMGFVEDTLRT